jgi:hypothetical protein
MEDIITDQRIPVQDIREQLGQLSPDQVEAGLVFLAWYDPALFRIVFHAAQTWDDGDRADVADNWSLC